MQSANVVSLRDSINYLGPVVKPRDDKKGTQGPGHGMTRKVVCAGAQSINYLGPVVKPRDDKKDVIDITWVPWSSHGMTRKVVCAGAQSINYLGPVVKPRDDKKDVIAYYLGPVVKPRDDKFFSYFSFFLNKLQI